MEPWVKITLRIAEPVARRLRLAASVRARSMSALVNDVLDHVDLVMLSGLRVPVGPAAWGRPISQRAITELAAQLDQSALEEVLSDLTGHVEADVDTFHPEGQANRLNVATLVRRLLVAKSVPFEMVASIEVPGHYGRSHVGALEFSLKVVSRLGASLDMPGGAYRLDVAEWSALLDSIAATLTSPRIVGPIADLAAVDPLVVRQPRVLHLRSGPPMRDLLLVKLRPIRDGGESHGAHMLSDPALDLADPSERRDQVCGSTKWRLTRDCSAWNSLSAR